MTNHNLVQETIPIGRKSKATTALGRSFKRQFLQLLLSFVSL